MKKWNKLIAAICFASMIFAIPGTSVFADEMPEEEPVVTEASTEEVVGEQRIQVGDGVTATFDAETGAVEFYSDGGTLWQDWYISGGFDIDLIKYIKVSSGTVYLPRVSSYIFGGLYDEDAEYCTLSNLQEIDMNGFDTSNVEYMISMFEGCSSLTSLDLRSFDISNVKYMNDMFVRCKSLTSVDLSSFNTLSVTDMGGMFSECNSLSSLDVSSFNTSNVYSMAQMFNGCSSLKTLDLSRFNTANVESMNWMFKDCCSLTSVNLSNFNTTNVTDIGAIFSGCSSLANVDLSSFDTSNVEEMYSLFNGCSSLTNVNLSGFKTSNANSMHYMFNGCSSLTSLDLSNFDTSNVEWMSHMFSGCSSLKTLDLSSFDTSNMIEMDNMFDNCSALHILKTPKKNEISIALPVTMFDDKGNEYTEIPASLKSTVLTRNKVNFFDVMDQTHPYYKAIYWAAEKKITGGYKDGTFGIDTPCTRGHAVMFLWKMAGAPAPAAVSRTPFPDVPKDHPYYKAVLWAQQNGITKGYTTGVNKGKFGVDDTCTRGQIMTFIWNFKNKPAPKTVSKSPFSDVPKTHPYYKAILWGSQNGVTKGYSTGPNAGKFGINDNCTRGQIVKFLYNIR